MRLGGEGLGMRLGGEGLGMRLGRGGEGLGMRLGGEGLGMGLGGEGLGMRLGGEGNERGPGTKLSCKRYTHSIDGDDGQLVVGLAILGSQELGLQVETVGGAMAVR